MGTRTTGNPTPSEGTSGPLFPPVGAGPLASPDAAHAAQWPRAHRQRPAEALLRARVVKKTGPLGQPAAAHIGRGHAASLMGLAARGGDRMVTASQILPHAPAWPPSRRRDAAGLTSLRTFSNE